MTVSRGAGPKTGMQHRGWVTGSAVAAALAFVGTRWIGAQSLPELASAVAVVAALGASLGKQASP
jgi:hypothetical protein